jgi:thymidine kinase|uniref:thymidine kinase n=1 Tax=viral metagenome TaxID=1070528 RepID=A0A6C0KQV6_9ZZZZ
MDFISGNICTLDIIFGPMFSGKTTELMRRLNICAEAKYKVLYINSIIDKRSEKGFSTHNQILKESDGIVFVKTNNLFQVLDIAKQYDIIGIDESQFFEDLKEFCSTMIEVHKKKVIVAGLNGDFERKPFGQINDLITLCDSITKLSPFCSSCRVKNGIMTPAIFSKRISMSKETILVGQSESYIPVCRDCYTL